MDGVFRNHLIGENFLQLWWAGLESLSMSNSEPEPLRPTWKGITRFTLSPTNVTRLFLRCRGRRILGCSGRFGRTEQEVYGFLVEKDEKIQNRKWLPPTDRRSL